MSKYVIEIPQSKGCEPIWEQKLRVAAYCQVSTSHEEQQSSLENQISIRDTFRVIRIGSLLQPIMILHPACGGTSVQGISRCLGIAEKGRATSS